MKKYILVLLILLTLLPISAVYAQDGATYAVELPDGTQIMLPQAWAFEADAANDAIYTFTSGDSMLTVYTPDATAGYAGVFGDAPTPPELLESIYGDLFEAAFDAANLESGDEEARYTFEDGTMQGFAAVFMHEDAPWFYAVYTPADVFEDAQTVADDIMAQLAPVPAAGLPATCYASTDRAYGASLRLGPGLNRGEYTSLTPDDGAVLVLGQAEADDGSLWYQVEENYDAVNELWVAASDVITSGNCETVGETDAPPIIAPAPGVVPAAPPAPADPVEPGASAPAESAPPPGDGSLIPAQGLWAVATAPTFLMSCEGGETISTPAGELYTAATVRINHGPGSNVTWYESGFSTVLTNNGGGYFTSPNMIDDPGMYGDLRLHVSSATVMTGEIVMGFLDIPCSGTLPLIFTYQG